MNTTTTARTTREAGTEERAPTLARHRGHRIAAAVAAVLTSASLVLSVAVGMTSMADAPLSLAADRAASAARG